MSAQAAVDGLGVGVLVGVFVDAGLGVLVAVGLEVGVFVDAGLGVLVAVGLEVGVFVDAGFVGVDVGIFEVVILQQIFVDAQEEHAFDVVFGTCVPP